jgi:DNA-binding beta-propeller fold protein YncE
MFTKRFALTRLAFLSRFTRFGGVTPRRAMQTVVALGASILFTTVSLPLRAQGGPTVTFQSPLPFLAGDNPVGPAGLAFDHSGNLFMSDYSNARVVELPAGCASTSCETVVPNLDLGAPIDVALDAAGDLFIADFSREMVYELPAGQTSEIALGTGWGAPSGISVDSAGDVWVADFLNNTIVEIPWNGTIFEPQITVVPNTWLNGVFGVALDKSNNVFIADSGGQQIVELPHGCTLVSCLVPVATNLGHPQALVADSSGNIFFVDTSLNYAAEVPTGSFGCASTSCLIYFAFGLNEPHGVAVDASDDVFIGDYGNGEVWEARPNPFNFGTISVGSKSAPVTAYFSFGAPTTLGSTPYQVLTQGKSGGDIAVAAGSTCAATSYVAGSACAVTAQFAPSAPGLRMGAVQLNGSSGNPIATAPIYGTGSGPQVVFPTNSDSTTSAVGSNFNDPYGVALDGSGDVFVADTGNNAVDEIVAVGGKVSSGSTVNTVSSVFNDPYGVAVDGSGDVFVADTFNNAVREIVAVGGQVSPSSTVNTVGNGFSLPTGVAVDSLGDVFVADYGNTAAKEIVAVNGQVSSASTVIPVGSGFTGPTGVAVDAAGDVFVADNGNNAVDEIVAVNGQVSAGSTVKPVGSGFSEPFAVTVDAAGDVFVADFDNNAVKEIFAVGGQVSSSSTVEAQGSGFTSPIGVALDASGDVFVADASFDGNISSQVTEIPLATPSALAFPTVTGAGTTDTTDDPLTAVVANDGNATLTFNLPATGDNPGLSTSNFTLDGSSTCTQTTPGSSTAFTLAEGAYCILAVDFTPKATGTLTDNLSLTDNTLNATSATQQIPLSGTAASGSTISSPTAGSTLTSASTTFTWNAGPAGTTGYGLNIGTTGVGSAGHLVNIGPLSGTSYDSDSAHQWNQNLCAALDNQSPQRHDLRSTTTTPTPSSRDSHPQSPAPLRAAR